MFFYTYTSWAGAAFADTVSFFALFGLSIGIFDSIEPDPAHGTALSVAAGVVVGFLLAADLVLTVKRLHRLPSSVRSEVIGALLVAATIGVYTWANPADPDHSPIFANFLTFLAPTAIMGAVYFLAGLALVDR